MTFPGVVDSFVKLIIHCNTALGLGEATSLRVGVQEYGMGEVLQPRTQHGNGIWGVAH